MLVVPFSLTIDCLAVEQGMEYPHLGKRVELPVTTEQLMRPRHQIIRFSFCHLGQNCTI